MEEMSVEVLTDHHVLEYPYSRSVGPVLSAFFTALRDGRLVGVTGTDGSVIVPPTEYDPQTAEPTGEVVEVGPGGVVDTWAWVAEPRASDPLDRPFAWALVRPDGATTSMLHVLDAGSPASVRTGMRVTASFRPATDRRGEIQDIEAFVPVPSEDPGPAGSGVTSAPREGNS